MKPAEAHLHARIQRRQGALALGVAFTLTEPWTILFGPSGSGKTTILRAIAGFVRPDSGRIEVGTQVLFDSGTRTNVAPHMRPVRSAAQSVRLFPHMPVRKNIGYGNGWAAKPRAAEELAEEVISLFRLDNLAVKMPSELSGGESQRASVARAVFSAVTGGGSLLLLDEPFTGLDRPVRDELIATLPPWLRRWRTPVLSVTHDVAEAFQLGAEVIRIADGKVAQQGPVELVLAEERMRLLLQLRPLE